MALPGAAIGGLPGLAGLSPGRPGCRWPGEVGLGVAVVASAMARPVPVRPTPSATAARRVFRRIDVPSGGASFRDDDRCADRQVLGHPGDVVVADPYAAVAGLAAQRRRPVRAVHGDL